MLRNLQKKGFASIVEVVITALIFSIAAFGIFTTTSMLRPQGIDSARRLKAAYAGKQIMDELRGKVSALTWNNAGQNLSIGNHSNIITVDGIDYTINYEITEDPLTPGIREVTMNITYPETTR